MGVLRRGPGTRTKTRRVRREATGHGAWLLTKKMKVKKKEASGPGARKEAIGNDTNPSPYDGLMVDDQEQEMGIVRYRGNSNWVRPSRDVDRVRRRSAKSAALHNRGCKAGLN